MNKTYLGIFDSGLGGITVVKAIQEALPHESIVFLADGKHMPYGSKTRRQIVSYSHKNVEILKRYPLKALVIACNTSDSLAGDGLRSSYGLPVIGVIDPAAEKAALSSGNGRIAVLATQATTASGAYEKAILRHNEKAQVTSIACPELVPLIEEGRFRDDDGILREVLTKYLEQVGDDGCDTLVLGCTHYDVLSGMIDEIMPGLNIVSSSRCLVEDLKRTLEENGLAAENEKPQYIYLSTADAESFSRSASLLIEDAVFETVK